MQVQFNSLSDVQNALIRAERAYIKRMSKHSWFRKDPRKFYVGMKLLKRNVEFKSSNCTFDPITMRAYSYGWWRFVDRIDGKVVFNSYRYSPSTGKHQSNVRAMLNTLGVKIDVTVECPKGLQDLNSGVVLCESRILELINLMQNPKSRKDVNKQRAKAIRELQASIATLKQLI